jgi:7-cyano-7-deazaguanine reductase
MTASPKDRLDTFPNPAAGRDYWIHIAIPEFTCLCPKTGQPDFAELDLHYVPGPRCVELKSLKLYIWGFRDVGAFHEAITNQILDELASLTEPRFMRLVARFNVRGGTYPTITVEHRAPGWIPAEPIDPPNPAD